MTQISSFLAELRRPRLLLNAARFGLADYRRDRDLKRLNCNSNDTQNTVDQLIAAEAIMEQNRKSGEPAYSACRHIELLIALLAESRLYMKPSAS